MQDGADSCRKQFHLPVTVGFAIVKVEYPGVPILCNYRLPEDELDKNFLLEIERRVSADSVIVIDQVEYAVDCRFAKQRITLRYSPDLKDIFIVEADRTLTPIRLLNKTENAFVKRKKIHLCRGEQE